MSFKAVLLWNNICQGYSPEREPPCKNFAIVGSEEQWSLLLNTCTHFTCLHRIQSSVFFFLGCKYSFLFYLISNRMKIKCLNLFSLYCCILLLLIFWVHINVGKCYQRAGAGEIFHFKSVWRTAYAQYLKWKVIIAFIIESTFPFELQFGIFFFPTMNYW